MIYYCTTCRVENYRFNFSLPLQWCKRSKMGCEKSLFTVQYSYIIYGALVKISYIWGTGKNKASYIWGTGKNIIHSFSNYLFQFIHFKNTLYIRLAKLLLLEDKSTELEETILLFLSRHDQNKMAEKKKQCKYGHITYYF